MLLTIEVLAAIGIWCTPSQGVQKYRVEECRQAAIDCVKKIDLSIDANQKITQCIVDAYNKKLK